MTITSDKRNKAAIFLLFAIVVALFAVLCMDSQSLSGPLIVCTIPFVLVIRYWMATERTIILTKDGCTVCFLWYKKAYTWRELKVKRLVNYENSFGYKSPYRGGAEFSPMNISKPRWLMPAEYSILAHPLSFIFVYFSPKELSQAGSQYPMIYTVDEAIFREKIKEWGIQLQEE